jgi:hypothetical protein
MFSAKERELFTLIKTDQNYGFQGFSSAFLSHLYNQSKIFTIFSQTEGTCKVIKEAQMCGLPVVLKKDLKGGVLSFLSEHKDAMFFDKYENAHEILIKSIQNYNNFQVDFEKNKKRIGENESLHMLKKYFYKLYEKNNQFFDEQLINTDNLNRRLPAHFFDDSVKWALSDEYRFKTTDITNFMMFKKFYNELKLSSKNEI